MAETLDRFDEICEGHADDLPEQAFLYVGDLDEVRAKAKEMKWGISASLPSEMSHDWDISEASVLRK